MKIISFNMRIFKSVLVLGVFSILVINSCAPTTSASYLSRNNSEGFTNDPDEVFEVDKEILDTIHVGDELFITVNTSSDDPNSFSQATASVAGNVDLLSYIVDEDGYVNLPYIKRVKIAGLTINDATDSLESELSQFLYLPSVSIRIINHRFSVLGEVNAPGLYTFNQKSINIYQAIATANDITVFGNRKNVLIVRQVGNVISKKYVNLLDEGIVTSDWYMIYPDDIIFVEPLGRKALGMETVPYDLIFSVFSSTLLVMTFVISLINQ